MRSWVLTLAALLAVGFTSPADAGRRHHRGWGDVQTVRHYRYTPRYNHVYVTRNGAFDPYAYRFRPRGYYPYYNSGYWVPAAELRYRRACCRPYAALPPYYRAWGYPNDVYPNAYVVRGGAYWHDRR